MPDYGSMFSNEPLQTNPSLYPDFAVDPRLTPAPVTPAVPFYQNPDKMRMLASVFGRVGAGMSEPGSFGASAGKVAADMASASAMNKGITQQSSQPPAAAPPNPTDVAKQYSDMAGAIKKLAALRPDLFPGGPKALLDAFAADPSIAMKDGGSNPTVPAASSAFSTPEPVAAGAMPKVQPFSDALVMSMTPDQMMAVRNYGTARDTLDVASREVAVKEAKHAMELGMLPETLAHLRAQTANLNSDAAYKDWERSPEGQASKYKLAAAGVTEAAKADKEKVEFLRAGVEKMLADPANASWANSKPDGFPMSIGSLLRLTAENSHAGTTFAQVLNATLDYKSTMATNRMRFQELQASKKDSEENKIYTQISHNAEVLRKMNQLQSPESFKTPEALETAKTLGLVRTPGMDAEIKNLQKMQEQLYKKVGLVYSPLAYLTDGSKDIVVTPEMLKEAVKKDKKKPTYEGRQYFSEIFNPQTQDKFFRDLFNPGAAGGL